jgi:signal transduction histidine kinase
MKPVVTLARQTSDMADGHFDRQIAPSTRIDEVGKLQNSFHTMQLSIARHVAELEAACTKMKQKNQELMIAKTMAEESDRKKTVFIKDMFHQIRTPLNIISGFAQVLRDGYRLIDAKELDVVTRDIKQNGQTISNIIDNWMKTLALEQRSVMTMTDRVDCNALCRSIVCDIVLRHPETVNLAVETDSENLVITTNKAYVTKILSELLHNANKFTLQGSIIIGCQRFDADYVSFYVADTGPGIPKGDRERIFTQFTKLNDFNEGLGMGLYLCRQLARKLGGSLEVDAEYADGTCMVLTLPVTHQPLG